MSPLHGCEKRETVLLCVHDFVVVIRILVRNDLFCTILQQALHLNLDQTDKLLLERLQLLNRLNNLEKIALNWNLLFAIKLGHYLQTLLWCGTKKPQA